MSDYKYAIMSKEYAEFIQQFYSCAHYADGALLLCGLTDEEIDTFTGSDVVRLDQMELADTQLVALVNQMLSATFTGKLIILSKYQGRYLYNNHPAFMPDKE